MKLPGRTGAPRGLIPGPGRPGKRGGGAGLLPLPSPASAQGLWELNFAAALKTRPEFAGENLVLTDAAGAEVADHRQRARHRRFVPGVCPSRADNTARSTPEAAAEGLAIFAEHTDDASCHPGKHPNIDRLIAVLTDGHPAHARIA